MNSGIRQKERNGKKRCLQVTLQSRVPVAMNGGPAQRPRGALAWGPGRSAGNHKALGSSWRGRGPRPPAPHFGEAVFSSTLGSSRRRCFRRVPPEPPGPNKTGSGPPVTEGLRHLLLPDLEGLPVDRQVLFREEIFDHRLELGDPHGQEIQTAEGADHDDIAENGVA